MWMSQSVHTACKLYYDIKNHILLYPLFSLISQSVNTGCKLYYDIKNYILLYPLFSFLCGYQNLLTQEVSYTMISKTISYCILFSLSYVNITIY